MITIPEFLKEGRFIKLEGKIAIEKWKDAENQFDIYDEELLKHIQEGKNYGFVCANGYFVIDCDSQDFFEKINKKLPPTFIVKTGKKGFHIYFKTEYNFDFNYKPIGNKQGEIRVKNCYVVGASCIHPETKKEYEIYQNVPVCELNERQIKDYILPILEMKNEAEKDYSSKDYSNSGIEYRAVIGYLFEGLSKEEIYDKMMNFPKWNKSHEAYKKITYEKALDYVTGERQREQAQQRFRTALNRNLVVDYLMMVEDFHRRFPFFYDRNQLFWIWDNEYKKYMIVDDTDMLGMVELVSRENQTGSVLRQKMELMDCLKIIGRRNIPQNIPVHWIQFRNCIYDLQNDERINPSSKFFCVNPIEQELGEFQDTPFLDKLFREWIKKEEDDDEKINKKVKLLYQIMAYCLYPDYPLARIFCLFGKGSNGKSVFMEIVTKFLGYDNCTSTSLENLTTNRFESAKLYKKLMCRLSEIHDRTLSKTSLLKNISGNDRVSVEFKNKNPFDAQIYSKILIGTNTIPISFDDTDGYYRRWLIVDFPNSFSDKRDIIKEIPEQEFENLSLKCVLLLKEILKEREFAIDGTIEQKKKEYNARANPIESFIEEKCEIGENYEMSFGELYDEYIKYLSERSFRGLSKVEFGKTIKQLGYKTKVVNELGISSYHIIGLILKIVVEKLEKTNLAYMKEERVW